MIKVVVFRCFAQGSKFGQIPLYSQFSSGWQIWSKYIVVIHTFPLVAKLVKYQFFHIFGQNGKYWLRSHLGFFYYKKVNFTIVSVFLNVTGFSHSTMVNVRLVCRAGNGGRIKAKFTIRPESQFVSQKFIQVLFF